MGGSTSHAALGHALEPCLDAIDLIGPQLHKRGWNYRSAVTVGDCIYAVPYHAKKVLRINCKTGTVQQIGPHLAGHHKYRSAVAVGDCVYAVPHYADQVLRINCKTGEVQLIGPVLDGACKYESAVAVNDCVYA
eukprot:2308972-Amphidinium_carterae.1